MILSFPVEEKKKDFKWSLVFRSCVYMLLTDELFHMHVIQ